MRLLPALLLLVASCTCQQVDRGALPAAQADATGTPEVPSDPGVPLAWLNVDAGGGHSCGVLNDGRLVCWGDPDFLVHTEEAVASDLQYADVRLGTRVGCALTEAGEAVCWCTHPDPDDCPGEPPPTTFARVLAGSKMACGERTDGSGIRCWGRGFEADDLPTGPVLHWAMDISAGCAVLEDTSLQCWGKANWPEPPPQDDGFAQITVGRRHACGLLVSGEAVCWGDTAEYIGDISAGDGYHVPFPDAPPGVFVALETFNQISCGIRPDASAECWYGWGELYDAEWALPDHAWVQLGLGEFIACGLTVEGEVVCHEERFEAAQAPALDELR